MFVTLFAAEGGGVPLAAEPIFTIGNFTITNSMIMGVLIGIFIVAVFSIAAAKSKVRGIGGFSYFIESVISFILNTLKNNFGGDEAKARKFLPLFLTFFVFILLNNLAGLMPGLGGSIYIESDGVKEALLRPLTTDLNGTIALALIAMITVQIFAIRERGALNHLKHYFSIMQPAWNPMNLFVGTLEILGEFIRLITLALRLFGVIYAGEVLLHVIADLSGNFAWLGVIPVIFMEIFFSAIQAYLFIMLSSVYLAMGTTNDHAEHHEEKSAKAPKAKASQLVTTGN
jgi:F-type H+-transporting ATPase subunit a